MAAGLAQRLWSILDGGGGEDADSTGQTTGTPLSGEGSNLLPPESDTNSMTTSPRPERPGVNSYGDWLDDGTGRSGGRGGGGRARKEYDAAMEATLQEIALLEAEAAAFLAAADAGVVHAGMMEYARKKAELLMAAQKQGLAITPELTAQIEEQARAYATAGLEAEAAAEKIEKIKQASEKGKDALGNVFDAILDGADSARQAVADLLKEIARMQFRKGMMDLIGGSGGGGIFGFLGGLLSADGGGYTGNSPRTGGLDGKGGFLAMLHPRETVTDHAKGQSLPGGQASVHVTVGVDPDTGNLMAFVDQRAAPIAERAASRMGQQIDRALPMRVQQINAQPRRR